MWNRTHFSPTEGFGFRWRPVLQVLALEMLQLPPADEEPHTPFEEFKALSTFSTKLRAGPHCK